MADLLWRGMFSTGLDEATSSEMHVFALKPNVSDFFPALAAADLQGVRRLFARNLAVVYQMIDQLIEERKRGRETGVRKNDLLELMLDMDEQGKDDDLVNVNRDVIRAFLTVSLHFSRGTNLSFLH
jgi:hypothetical protein